MLKHNQLNNNVLRFMQLDEWKLITIKGPDSKNFLQNQLTIDMNKINNHNFYYASHCTAQGKMLTNMQIFQCDLNYYGYIIRTNIVQSYFNFIKKYTKIYNINIQCSDKKILGCSGFNIDQIISIIFKYYKTNKLFFIYKKNIFLKFLTPVNRYLIILNSNTYDKVIKYLNQAHIPLYNSDFWTKFNMEIGYPIIDNYNFGKFIPQQVNMNNFYAIDLNKGCYLGQEILNRYFLKKINTHKLYLLEGKINKIKPQIHSLLEIKTDYLLNKYTFISSKILTLYNFKNNIWWIQVLLRNNINIHNINNIRFIEDKQSNFIIKNF
ncbi:hypothetical protein [Enterobacteriaceae endosymbiont of Neohaemonia nigricornis]|uniref:hypothetical protein n=1 Tax=Enterobacteriaceae endosymbiont of Neohaemonia nigricornis TaxID=2675792 RepID=UPI0014490AB2|nr:hypothetical protein [Enterobacteriaceae endosymbiont of Neohaemonia nigricornis]QJC30376.1 hypothetical protein GJT85_00915 [Enterobacteriaceae endosymbiont of Neohaemonia nigricornis]